MTDATIEYKKTKYSTSVTLAAEAEPEAGFPPDEAPPRRGAFRSGEEPESAFADDPPTRRRAFSTGEDTARRRDACSVVVVAFFFFAGEMSGEVESLFLSPESEDSSLRSLLGSHGGSTI